MNHAAIIPRTTKKNPVLCHKNYYEKWSKMKAQNHVPTIKYFPQKAVIVCTHEQ